MKLFYGSKDLLLKPTFGKGNPNNDYGLGFYMTKDYEIAKLWASKNENGGFLIEYDFDMKGLNVLHLETNTKEDIIKWITLLVQHRFKQKDLVKRHAIVEALTKKYSVRIDSYDVVIGYRADDAYFAYAEDFLEGRLSFETLSKAMKLGNLGLQYVAISKKAFDRLNYVKHEEVSFAKDYLDFFQKTKQEYHLMSESDDYINNETILDILREGK